MSSRKSIPVTVAFEGGVKTYKPNDNMKNSEVAIAQDARYTRVGRYRTRKGLNPYSIPVGSTASPTQASTTGASTFAISELNVIAEKFTATSSNPLWMVKAKLSNTTGRGTVLCEVYTDNAGVPGTRLGQSAFDSSVITSTPALVPAYFVNAPSLVSGTTYWIVLRGQKSMTSSFNVSTTTNTSLAKTSIDAGVSFTATAFSINYEVYTATAGGVLGVFTANTASGTVDLFVHGTSLYSVNNTTGALTVLNAAIGVGITDIRWAQAQDTVYYTTGVGKPRKVVLSTMVDSEITAAPFFASNMINHISRNYFVDPADPTKFYYTNTGALETFDVLQIQYVPTPKTGDNIMAWNKLNGLLYIQTRRNKYQLYGNSPSTFQLEQSTAQKGTFSQESTVTDRNYIYFASDDGVYQFNGTTEKNIALDILDKYNAILIKNTIRLELHGNKLFVFHTPVGGAENSECWVYNTAVEQWESKDTNTYIGRTFARQHPNRLFVQASNRIGAIFYGESESNNYNNLGAPINFELATSFMTFGAPSNLKRISKWRPEFGSVDGSYTVQCGYVFDYASTVNYAFDINLATGNALFDNGVLWDNGALFGSDTNVLPTTTSMWGEFRRVQIHYKHYAAYEPVSFESHTLVVQTQRIR